MSTEPKFITLKQRIAFIQDRMNKIGPAHEMTLADRILVRSLDSHLSDLRAQLRSAEIEHPLQDFMELRFKGFLVDAGTMPLELLSVISGNLAGLVQKAVHRISSGKDSRKVPVGIKQSLDMRLADLRPGSTKLAITFSTGACELVDTVSSHAVKEIFSVLEATDEDSFISKLAEIGSNSTHNLKNIVEECERNGLSLEMSWIGPLSEGRRSVSLNKEAIDRLTKRLAFTEISKPWNEIITGELSLLSMYGKLEVVNAEGKIKASYPIDMLTEIQSKFKVGSHVSMVASVTEIHNDRLKISRRNYMIKSLN